MPATFNNFVPLIMWLSVEKGEISHRLFPAVCSGTLPSVSLIQPGLQVLVRHTFTSGNTNSSGFDLKAQAALIFPQRSGNPWFHARRGVLSSGIKTGVVVGH